MKLLITLFCLFLISCASPSIDWDLSKPIFVFVNSDIKQSTLFMRALPKAIHAAGGSVSTNSIEVQKIIIEKGNPNSDFECKDKQRAAVSLIKPYKNIIVICPVDITWSQSEADAMMYHELGHILGERADHLSCESKAIMAPTITCHGLVDVYPQVDIDYICSSGNTINGVCK